MPLRLLSGVTLRYPCTQGMCGAPGKVCQSATARACAVFLRMPVGVTCQRLAGFRGNRLGHAAAAHSLTACQLSAGEALGEPRLPAQPRGNLPPFGYRSPQTSHIPFVDYIGQQLQHTACVRGAKSARVCRT